MIAALILFLLAFTAFFIHLYCSVYKVPHKVIVRTSIKSFIFIIFFAIQLSPIYFFYTVEGNPDKRINFTTTEFKKCMSRVENPSNCERMAETYAANEFDHPNYELLFFFALFITVPTSGVSLKLAESINQQKLFHYPLRSNKESFNIFIKALLKVFTVFILLSFGLMIVWGFCLPPSHVPDQIKTISLIVCLPLLFIIIVMVEAFGKAFAHSGIHSPQNAVSELMDIHDKMDNQTLKRAE